MVFADITDQKPIWFFVGFCAKTSGEHSPPGSPIAHLSAPEFTSENIDSPVYKINYLPNSERFQEEKDEEFSLWPRLK
jgi:hypothetical protein